MGWAYTWANCSWYARDNCCKTGLINGLVIYKYMGLIKQTSVRSRHFFFFIFFQISVSLTLSFSLSLRSSDPLFLCDRSFNLIVLLQHVPSLSLSLCFCVYMCVGFDWSLLWQFGDERDCNCIALNIWIALAFDFIRRYTV